MAVPSKLDATLAVLNGLVGDHLARTDNGLATEMALVHHGKPIALTRSALSRAYPAATGKLVLLVHGLMSTESVWRFPDGTDYGTRLESELGFTPLAVRYNSGRRIPDNGAELAALLERLIEAFPVPVEELVVIGHSMGGLVFRSACHAAVEQGHGWLVRVKRAVYVGTPHLGAPMERAGRLVAKVLRAVDDPYTRLAADIANLRSEGIKDLGDAPLTHAQRAKLAVDLRAPSHPVPLLAGIRHHLIAGALWEHPLLATLFGDVMVPVPSATAGLDASGADAALPPCRIRILPGISHLPLAHHPEVYAQLRGWLEESP